MFRFPLNDWHLTQRRSRIIGLALLVLLGGCSAVQTLYRGAPTLLYWWLDSYVDFDPGQTLQARQHLTALQSWHRSTELPTYAALLRRLQEEAPRPVTAEQVCGHVAQVRGLLRRLAEHSADGLSEVAPTLQESQLHQLAKKFEQTNVKWRAQWLDGTPDELLERRWERTVERYEDFYGRLSDSQQSLLRQRLAASGFDAHAAWTERQRRQQDILRVLREHLGSTRSAHVKAEMLALLLRSLESPDPAYRQHFERLLQDGCQTLAALHNGASATQRQRLIERLRAYEADMAALSGS